MNPAKILTDPDDLRAAIPALASRHDSLPQRVIFFNSNLHAALWTDYPVSHNGARTGALGCFAADSQENAKVLLSQCEIALRREGCEGVIGPLDGSTWYSYRFVVEQGDRPRFGFEPWNPPEWPVWWRANGYCETALYFSAESRDLSRRDLRLERVRARIANAGLEIANAKGVDPDDLLQGIYELSLVAFRDNAFYTPITAQDFMALYRPLITRAPPEWILLARRGGRIEGFLFASPDPLELASGRHPESLILKTVAVRPGRENAGLGALLVEEIQLAAHASGYTRVVHALMHESNRSLNLSGHYATPFRRYALFAKTITDPVR